MLPDNDKKIKKELRSRCPVFGKCGGCSLLNMDYARQLSFKQAKCVKLLGRFGRVSGIKGMDEPFHYRHKVQAAFTTLRGGRVISGIYKTSTHSVVAVDSCLLEDELADEIVRFIRSLLISFRLGIYNEKTGSGFLRHVLVRAAHATGEYLVVLVTGTSVFPRKNDFIKALADRFAQIKTVVLDVNDAYTSMVLSGRQTVLYGDGYITDVMLGMRFRISASSFYQINPVQTEYLYKTALDLSGLDDTKTFLDAYCGVGTIGLIASVRAKSGVGVETVASAVTDARKNAEINGVKNMSFICADAAEYISGAADAGERYDVVLMDPPRTGSTTNFMSSVCKMAPQTIVYVSCSPDTLARDLGYLTKQGYKVKKIQPVDMFPWTGHVESVVKLIRQ